ncbi:hypothetical protein Tco_1315114 [Tanacetum coccineum]
MTHRSCLRWKPTGKIFKIVGLRWVPTEKIFTSSTTKVDSEPTNGSNEDITNQYECEQSLDVSVGTLNLSAELAIQDHNNKQSSSKLVPNVLLQQIQQFRHNKSWNYYSVLCTKNTSMQEIQVCQSLPFSDNLQQHDTQPTANIHPTLELIIPTTNVNVEENM